MGEQGSKRARDPFSIRLSDGFTPAPGFTLVPTAPAQNSAPTGRRGQSVGSQAPVLI